MSVVIIGGGLSGLSLAWYLREAGTEVALFEAGPRLGGSIQTHARDGFVLETGPNGFVDREPAVRRLAARLGVAHRIRPAAPAAQRPYVFTRGQLREVPGSASAFLGSDLLPFSSRLRVLGELLTGVQQRELNDALAPLGRRRFGDTATAVILDALQSDISAGDLEALSVSAAFPRLVDLKREHRSVLLGLLRSWVKEEDEDAVPLTGTLCSFEGGLRTFIDALAANLGPLARTHARVEALAPFEGGWRVLVRDHGRLMERSVRKVVLALPAYASAALLRPLDVELARVLESITYSPQAVVHLGYAPGTTPPPEGFGFVVPAEEERPVLGVLHTSTVFPWRAEGGRILYTCMLGGSRRPELATQPESELVHLARRELCALAGVSASPVLTEVVRWPRALPQYTVGHADRVARLDAAVARFPGLTLAGNAYHGVGMPDCLRNAAALAETLRAGSPPVPLRVERRQVA